MKVEDMVKMESISTPPSRASKTAKKPKRYFSIFGSNEIILIDVWRDFGNLHLNLVFKLCIFLFDFISLAGSKCSRWQSSVSSSTERKDLKGFLRFLFINSLSRLSFLIFQVNISIVSFFMHHFFLCLLSRFSFAILFTGKWGSFEAEKESKKQKKAERAAVKKQQSEKVRVEKEKEVLEEKKTNRKPSDLLKLWSHESPSKRGCEGKTVLGREADMLLMSWEQRQRVASYFTPLGANKKDERSASSSKSPRATEPLLEAKIMVGLALGTILPAGQSATLHQATRMVALLFPYYQTKMDRCTRISIELIFIFFGLV